MLHDVFFIARKDVRYMLLDRETILWLFVMPVVLFYFIGTVTTGFSGGQPARKTEIVLQAPQSAGFLGDQVQRRLEENNFRVLRPTEQEQPRSSRRISLPDSFTESIVQGRQAKILYSYGESDLNAEYDVLRVKRAVYTVLADVVALRARDGDIRPQTLSELDAMPRTLSLDIRPAGKRKVIPTGFEQAIPGIMVMFTLVVMLTSGAVTLVIERRQGLLRRLASTPISTRSIVAGKWAGRLLLGLVQIAFGASAGTLLFGMDWGPQRWMVGVVLLAWCAHCASLGLFLGSLSRTEGQAAGIGVLAANALAAIGGCWWPIEVTPPWMQAVSRLVPTGWAMDAMHRLISFQDGAAGAVPDTLALLRAALVFGVWAARHFRYE